MNKPITIYEGRDVTNDEMYFTIGVWLDLDTAIMDIKAVQNPLYFNEFLTDDTEFVHIVIVARETGLASHTERTAYKFSWSLKWNENLTEYRWILDK